MPYSLIRQRDRAGDSGQMSCIGRISTETNKIETQHGMPPTVGWNITVGSLNGRSYSAQDYWSTTIVTEILEDSIKTDEDGHDYRHVVFKTTNSIYEWNDF